MHFDLTAPLHYPEAANAWPNLGYKWVVPEEASYQLGANIVSPPPKQYDSTEPGTFSINLRPDRILAKENRNEKMDAVVREYVSRLTQIFQLSPGDALNWAFLVLSATMDGAEVKITGTWTPSLVINTQPPAAGKPGGASSPTASSTGTAPSSTTSPGGSALPSSPPPADIISQRSGILPSDGYMPPSIRLQRTTRGLSGDAALWLLIKLNADSLSWDNYIAQMDRLFFPEDPATDGRNAPLFKTAAALSRRRSLPFTDSEAYRALKVATEAFVVTWGAVVPGPTQKPAIEDLLRLDPAARALANERLGLKLEQQDVNALVRQYFGDPNLPSTPSLPYLQRVAQALVGTDAAHSVQSMVDAVTLAEPNTDSCGEGCLWLQFWNRNISAKLTQPPLIELIWSYWMEELQLVQTMNAVSRRFQNVSSGPNDPLAALELDPLRPLNNIIWGWVQDEQHRLPIERRAAEYLHEYGFQLFGKAVPRMQSADTRSKFLAAFHTLLNLCVPFFRQADDTTVVPDGFPLLNALREVNLILSEGAHNQFRDLPSTARIEMMMQQWILARPEFREYLPRRSMVAYPEPWMHSVESMRKLQGWGDTNTYQFWQLATTGEQIVSSIRWGDWNSIDDPTNAANWAAYFRPEIQTYIHSYRAVTGIDVSAEPVDVQVPGRHLLRRMQEQKRLRIA